MAIQIQACSETSTSLCTSPRISFSHDLLPLPDGTLPIEHPPFRLDASLLDPNHDFNFWVSSDSIDRQPPSSADELFSNGLIRPLQSRHANIPSISVDSSKHSYIAAAPSTIVFSVPSNPDEEVEDEESTSTTTTTTVKEIMSSGSLESDPKSQSKSFWRFNRSSSLHCENTHKKSSFWSLPPLLSRSNSTGSVSNHKRFQNLHKPKSSSSSSSSSSNSGVFKNQSFQKPPLQKGGPYGNNGGVRITPVLNVPPYISKGTANFFGLGSFIRPGKDKKTKKSNMIV